MFNVASGQRLQRICKVVNRRWNLCSLVKQFCFLLSVFVFYLTRHEVTSYCNCTLESRLQSFETQMPFVSTLPGVLSFLYIFISRNGNQLRYATLSRVGLQQAQKLAPGTFHYSSDVPTFEQSPAAPELLKAGNPWFFPVIQLYEVLDLTAQFLFYFQSQFISQLPQRPVCLNAQGQILGQFS